MKTFQTHRFVITKFTFMSAPIICGVLFDASNHPLEVFARKEKDPSQQFANESVYIGKVQKVLSGQGAFVRLSGDTSGYLPFTPDQKFYFVKKYGKNETLNCEDEIVVQIKKQPIKTKEMVLSSKPDLHSDHLILLTGTHEISVSSKLKKSQKEELKALFSEHFKERRDFGFMIRTNAASVDTAEILNEADTLYEKYLNFINHYSHHSCYEMLIKGQSKLEEMLRPLNFEYTNLITDQTDIYQELTELANTSLFSQYADKITFYEDDSYPLYKLYGLETLFTNLTKSIVWLNSGANIIIEQTEALTVIDVNSSRQATKKEIQLFDINKEAAKEIALQIKLRNISGIIIVDFINLDDPADKAELLSVLRDETRYDSCRVTVLDYTKLGLVEMTREKKYPSLKEVLTLA
ncbi:MAG: ribonuclease E/G [Lachnospiraceae bacterium]|nr:ribonuclease E/G [Lachnospiraceae bacterium]